LLTVYIGINLTTIGSRVFESCSSLISVKIYSLQLQKLANDAFFGCNSLVSFAFLGNVCPSFISKANFTGSKLPANYSCQTFVESEPPINLNIPLEVTLIKDFQYFFKNDILSISIHSNITYIGEYSFASCGKLSELTISSGVLSIKDSSFLVCNNLLTINIKSNSGTIGNQAFKSCLKLTTVEISSGITIIGDNAFSHCVSLLEIHIPNSVISLVNIHLLDVRSYKVLILAQV
jgi:hypothetical protein